MKDTIQRFGAAMFVPVLLFPAAGMLLGLTVMLLNQDLFPWATPGSTWFNVSTILLQSSLAIFNNMSLIFAVGLPIALAKKASGRAVLATLVSYITFNYVIGGILQFWSADFGVNYAEGQRGLTEIGGILTLDTNLLGAIVIAGISVSIHNKFFEKKLADWAAVFSGTPLVVIISFPIMVTLAVVTCYVWPSIQGGIESLQTFLVNAGALGVWLFTLLERLLIPTGLHHFVYGPVFFGPVAVDGGTVAHWIQHIQEYAASDASLTTLFPQGGLMLTGMGKVFGCTGISLAIYATAKEQNKKMVMGLLLGATITAILTGITEPIEFTFLFIAPLLFVVHALLAATMATISFLFGVSGNFQTGLIDFVFQNWLPLASSHWAVYAAQIVIGLSFTAIYFFVFRFLILKYNLLTPGRDDSKAKLYSKKDLIAAKMNVVGSSKAKAFIDGLGGAENIASLTNCATRLRIKVHHPELVKATGFFQANGAVNLVRSGDNFQVIVGLTVPQVREEMSQLIHV